MINYKTSYHRNNCRGCFGKNITPFLNLGVMPLAGGFLTKDQISKEIKVQLKIYFCNDCGLVQVLNVVKPEVLFKNYFYISSVIPSLSSHFKDYAIFLKKRYLNLGNASMLEFGCNDGVLLQNFLGDKNIRVIGIDPSENVSLLAKKKGLNVITDYFNIASAKKIKEQYGSMDVVTGSNVFAHTDNIHEIIKSAKYILKDNGVFIVEVHYLSDLIKDIQYDSIYHEHLSYYSVIALNNILSIENLKIIDVRRLTIHGGGIRIISAFKNANRKVLPSVKKFITSEKRQQLDKISTYLNFSKKINKHKKQLLSLLRSLKKQRKTIVGYGASGRGVILVNFCGITNDILDYVVDVSPLRQKMLMPGVHLPICSLEKSRRNRPDYFLVLAWNYIDSIIRQEKALKRKGVKFIVPFPKITII